MTRAARRSTAPSRSVRYRFFPRRSRVSPRKTENSSSRGWKVGWAKWVNLEPWRYPSGILGIPDTTQPAIPLTSAARGPVFAGPSASTPYAIEVFFLGVDGDLYGHYDWQPWAPGPWQRIKVRDFAMREGSDAQLAADRMFVLSSGGNCGARRVSRRSTSSSWEALSAPLLALSRFAVFTEPGTCHVIATATDGSIWATSIVGSQEPEWIPLGMPRGFSVLPEMRVAGAIPYPGRLDIFAIASDGIAHTRMERRQGLGRLASPDRERPGIHRRCGIEPRRRASREPAARVVRAESGWEAAASLVVMSLRFAPNETLQPGS